MSEHTRKARPEDTVTAQPTTYPTHLAPTGPAAVLAGRPTTARHIALLRRYWAQDDSTED